MTALRIPQFPAPEKKSSANHKHAHTQTRTHAHTHTIISEPHLPPAPTPHDKNGATLTSIYITYDLRNTFTKLDRSPRTGLFFAVYWIQLLGRVGLYNHISLLDPSSPFPACSESARGRRLLVHREFRDIGSPHDFGP